MEVPLYEDNVPLDVRIKAIIFVIMLIPLLVVLNGAGKESRIALLIIAVVYIPVMAIILPMKLRIILTPTELELKLVPLQLRWVKLIGSEISDIKTRRVPFTGGFGYRIYYLPYDDGKRRICRAYVMKPGDGVEIHLKDGRCIFLTPSEPLMFISSVKRIMKT